jgi:cytoskeletal protein CcmA (bactofilin family)
VAIFGKDGAKQGSHNGSTIISAGTKLAGDLCLSDDLHVDGRIEGDIDSTADVVVGADGQVEGLIEASSVIVSGQVEGSIRARRLEIIAGGSVTGDVHTAEFVIEPGGRFSGSSENLSDEEARSENVAAASSDSAAANRRPVDPGATSGKGRASGADPASA